MSTHLQPRVIEAEERFRQAQMHSDLRAQNELVAPELLFTSRFGQVVRKADDLAFHRSGVLRLTGLIPSEQIVQAHSGFAVVSVLMHLVGTYQGAPIDQRIRYTRVWMVSPDGSLQIIAGHASEVQSF